MKIRCSCREKALWLVVLGVFSGAETFGAVAELRTWTSRSGEAVEAVYVNTTLNQEVLLEKSDGIQIKVPLSELSPDDLDYVALCNPPRLKIEFADKTKVETLDSSDRWPDNPAVTKETVQFKVSIRQEDSRDYPYPLTVEYYAVAYQYLDQDNYCLLQKGRQDFSLNDKNSRSVEISTSTLRLPFEFTMNSNHYGRKYCAYLVVITDRRGEVIAHRTSKDWLFEHLDALRKLPVNAFFDETCTRRHATGPKPNY